MKVVTINFNNKDVQIPEVDLDFFLKEKGAKLVGGKDKGDESGFSSLKVVELRNLLEEHEIPFAKTAKKAELIEIAESNKEILTEKE